ncbi:hypothetical protein [Oryza sativa Japonica Group]|jgi:hypothetical protein|uniref:Uncharacterized protein n=2 Tax=Oryza sativa subsp. japonica TaxID=39947 RepID=Q5QL98_ORYSJ|nr:hypothetical protein [Oryza sativa Japonica Group]BAD73804.1 hypothetical protein [Oryza sativa Japonica Group]
MYHSISILPDPNGNGTGPEWQNGPTRAPARPRKEKVHTEGPPTCHRITTSSLNSKTGYNASPNLQNQCKLGPSTVLTPVLTDVAADSAWDPCGSHMSDSTSPHLYTSLPLSSPFQGRRVLWARRTAGVEELGGAGGRGGTGRRRRGRSWAAPAQKN